MHKNVTGQKIQLFAFDTTTNLGKTGDAANITAYVSKDHGTVTVLGDTSATEMDSTNAKGIYVFDLTQGETNADELTFTGKSTTANVSVVTRFISTNPPNFTTASIDSNGRIDANATQLAGQTVTAAAGVTFPTSVASPTNITAGTITTVTNLTNAPPDSSGVTTLLGKFTGITLLAQWLGLIAGKQTGNTTARTELNATGAGSGTYDETTDSTQAIRDRGDSSWATAVGFSTHSAADVWAVGTRTLTSFGTLVSDVATAVWAAGTRTLTGFGSLVSDIWSNGTRTLTAGTNIGFPTAADNADAVWDEALAGHATAGSAGAALTAAAAAGDPWAIALPGAYGAGTAGKIIGDNINATISSRASQTSVDDLPTNAELGTALGDVPTAAEIAVEILDTQEIENGFSLREVARLWDSALGAKANGMGTTNGKFRNLADTKDRIDATIDADGNRTAVTLDLTP